MPPYSGVQKQQIAQFVNFTQAKDAVAAKFLKQAKWNVEAAVDEYFQNPQVAGESTAAINKVFDLYQDKSDASPDEIGTEGVMRFLADINVELSEITCLAVSELVKSPSIGEFNRKGFLEGWRAIGCDSVEKMAAHAAKLRSRIPIEPDLFRRVYRFAFPLCLVPGQRGLQFEPAVDQWKLFFTPENGGIQWNTPTTPWLDWWIEFLEERAKRPINKDLWNQVEVFMRKTHEDEAFAWWSADGAWPGALDDFVSWVREKRQKNSEMEVE